VLLGVPVCCSNVVALPEQVGDVGLLFDPLDCNDIYTKIMLYLKNDHLRSEKVIKGLAKIKKFNHVAYKNKLLFEIEKA
jgi:hypothetical protein